ncbi:MAG: hypothetical protein JSR19_13090 [Proteobacteria bacterium]|nr:hypothetical protein [Pseudomonadota bacterium]HQR03442.1 PilC/PilY family type IV pilus protein [Rhodocyclaceae bacterium]
MKPSSFRRITAWCVMGAMLLTQTAQVAALTLASAPLANSTTSVVRPNIMYVLDDSGSMAWDFSPDYISYSTVAADPGSLGGTVGDGATAYVGGGTVTNICSSGAIPSNCNPPGGWGTTYTSAPAVVIQGGGGTGATAHAVPVAGSYPSKIANIQIDSAGAGYTSAPFVALVGGLNSAVWGMCWGTTSNNLGGTPRDTTQSPSCTTTTQIPYATGAVNRQYYDPNTLYTPPVRADGTSYPAANPAAALQNGYSGAATTNLVTSYPHEVWCNSSTASPSAADPTSGGKCVENSDTSNSTLFPNAAYNFRKTYSGPASYYVMSPAEYCSDANLTNCVSATTAQVIGGVTFNIPALFRWCSYYNPLTHGFGNCQASRDLTHYIPNYLGGWVAAGAQGVQATATIVIQSVSAGQSITSVTVGGTDIVSGATFTAGASDTPTTMAQAICTTINANTLTSGYGCAQTGATILLQAAIAGTTPNGQQVLVTGPPAAAAVNSTGTITVLQAPINYQITGITLTRTDTSTAQLISGSIVSSASCGGGTGVSCGNIAQAICQGINSGPNQSAYIAKSGSPADPTLTYGTCQSTVDAWVSIQRISNDTVDNGATITVSGPPTSTQYPGTITVNPTGGPTRIDDITLNGTSVLTSKPLLYPSGTIADGLATSAIAADIASKFSRAGCTAAASGATVNITGSASCNGPLVVVANPTKATGKFRVTSSGHPGKAGDLGGIQVGITTIVGHITSAQLVDGTQVLTNANTLAAAVGAGFTAAAPVANGSNYDVLVSAPAGNTYNNVSFSFLSGSAASATAGQAPQWTFPITNATADNAPLTSITCGGTTVVSGRSTGTTSANVNYVQNLQSGLSGQTVSGYSYSCTNAAMASPQYRCTVTGPVGAPACANLSITPDPTITLSTTSPAAAGGSGAYATWTLPLTGATTDNQTITSLSCGGSGNLLTGSINTGTPSSYATSLTTGTGGINGRGINSYNWTCLSAGNCTLTGPAGASACPGGLSTNVDAGIGLSITAVNPGAAAYPQWSFNLTGATTDNRSITGISCAGTSTISGSASTGSTSPPNYANTLQNNINLAIPGSTVTNGWRTGGLSFCTNSSSTQVDCTVARARLNNSPADRCPGGINVTTYGINLSVGPVTQHYDNAIDGGLNRYYYTFSITNVVAPSEGVTQIACAGDSSDTLMTGSADTGASPSQVAQRINNLANSLSSRGANGFSYSCPATATTGSPVATCTINGPASCASSNLNFSYSGGSGISVNGSSAPGVVNGNRTIIPAASPTWSLAVTAPNSGTAGDNLNIYNLRCNGINTMQNFTTPNTGVYNYLRVNNLATGLISNLSGGYSVSDGCGAAATQPSPTRTCTIAGPNNCATLSVTKSGTISVGAQSRTTYAGSSPTWIFDIQNATAANKTISALKCGTTSILPGTPPNTGTAPASLTYQRINNLTGAVAPSTSGNIGSNGYTLSCPPATATSPSPTCTLTGPVGAAACGINAGQGFVINADSSISFGAVTQTNPGSSSSAGTEDFAPYLSQVSAFSGGYAAEGTTVSGIPPAGIATGTISTSASTMSNGSPPSALAIPNNANGSLPAVTMSGGANADPTANHWTGVGIFRRIDVAPANNSYNRTSARTDCTAATCTYAQEIQNFANWYTYYRTRVLMMKSASSLAFSQLGPSYRIGYDNICNAYGNTVQLPLAQFADTGGEVLNQRTNWWGKLIAAYPSCSTPLRAQLAKIGHYYAHMLGASPDPLQYSCQQNFMLLVTDGFWNENEPSNTTLTTAAGTTDVGNVDNNAATAPRPYYDGQMPSTTCPPIIGTTRGLNYSSCRTLADVAWYYYSTDLRSAALGNTTNSAGLDVSTNNVNVTPNDPNQAQHLVFYAMGLGIDGYLKYRSDYQTAQTGDFAAIKAGTLNWPAVANLDPTGVDDMWHATVNGHGKYFNARNLPNVVTGLRSALNEIGSRVGSAAAAATSNLQPVAGDNFAYVASYTTVDWTGDLQSRSIDLTTGAVSSDTNCGVAGSGCQWSTQALLDAYTWSARRIFVAPVSNASGDPLRLFTYGNLTPGEQAYFSPTSLSQYPTLSVSNPTDITAFNLVNFLRGNRGLESDGNSSHPQIWRLRTHVMGDVVDTQPTFMKAPSQQYADPGYSTFTTSGTAASRRPVIFVSAQDGMIHAFNADTAPVTVSGAAVQPGGEMWAYIPRQAMASMKVLADVNYTHQFFVDGLITIGDANFGGGANDWHTVMVAGQGPGGTSYVALDVTDPTNPIFLWEFSTAQLGYSVSNASIAKTPGGNWAVFFSSGYNNSDGVGRLFALNPKTGSILAGFPMSTGSGSAGTPSNLGKISAWVNSPSSDNTATQVYSGDLNGDLWRFDLTGTLLPVFKLAHLSAGGVAEPISTKPELTQLSTGTRVVYIGTGKYLELSDLTSTTQNSFYAIKDTLGADNGLGAGTQATWNPQTDTTVVGGLTVPMFLQRKLIETMDNGATITTTANGATVNSRMVCSGSTATVSSATGMCANENGTAMDWTIYGGWYLNFPDSGERMNVDMKLVMGTLVFATNLPAANSCTVGGTSWLNDIDFQTGLSVAGSMASQQISDSLVVGVTAIKIGSGFTAIVTKSNYQQLSAKIPVASGPGGFLGKRNLWREFEAY